MANKKVPPFSCTQPCGNCPYRTDAPLKLWHKSEYEKLLESEHDYLGNIYNCHKNNGSFCVGWMMKQYENNFPSNMLRIAFSKANITQNYFDSLTSPVPLYNDVVAMIKANYPDLLKEKPSKIKTLTRIVTQFRKGVLSGRSPNRMCWAICAPLQGFLNVSGYITKLIEGYIMIDNKRYDHFWLSYKGIIIDPTASQFKNPNGEDMPEVYIGEKPEWYEQIKK